jgi:hypothetical protein
LFPFTSYVIDAGSFFEASSVTVTRISPSNGALAAAEAAGAADALATGDVVDGAGFLLHASEKAAMGRTRAVRLRRVGMTGRRQQMACQAGSERGLTPEAYRQDTSVPL